MQRFYNSITDYMDGFLKYSNEPYGSNNYLVGHGDKENDSNTYVYVLRVPGQSVGCIFIDKMFNKISHIEIYGDFPKTYCYTEPYDILTKMLQEKFVGANWSDFNSSNKK